MSPCRTFALDLTRIALVLVAGLAVACSGTTDAPDAEPSEANPLDSEESALFFSLNEYRQNHGVAPVKQCVVLNVSASKHSDDMRDQNYLDDTAPDGTTARARACSEGYQPACDNTAMAELVGSGLENGDPTLDQWTKDATTEAIVVNPGLTVAGVGRSLWGIEKPAVWTLDFGASDDPSCGP